MRSTPPPGQAVAPANGGRTGHAVGVRGLYPPIEPYASGLLDVGDGNRVYWETCGNPRGKPALVLHGGPGSGSTPAARRYFDPDRYRIVLFDQRGCGRSTPHAAEPATDLHANTTHHLIADIEHLRGVLGVERWLVFGGSWGLTLAVAYAEAFPNRVSEVVLAGVALTRRVDVEWLTLGLRDQFPEEWARFAAGAPLETPDDNLVDAYRRRLHDPDPTIREQGARDWCRWEDALVKVRADEPSNPRYDDARFRMAFARIVTHYFHPAAWLGDDELLVGADRLAGVPAVLVHGRADLGSPLTVAQDLARAWSGSELVIADDTGHSSLEPAIADQLVMATDRFAATGSRVGAESVRRPHPGRLASSP
jgi:proline iminopeptidase